MKTIICDRCGQDTKGMHIAFQGELLSEEFAKKTGRPRYEYGPDKDIDLCNDCRNDLTELLSTWLIEVQE